MPERSFGRTVRYRRTKLGLSQAKLGELVGRSTATIRSWERDTSRPTDPEVLATLAAILGLSERQLFDKADVERPQFEEISPTVEQALATLQPVQSAESVDGAPRDNNESDHDATSEPVVAEANPTASMVSEELTRADEPALQPSEPERESVGVDGGAAYVAPPDPYVRTPPTPTLADVSYMEDRSQRQMYRVRTLATLVGVVALVVALIWALQEGVGAFGEWWDAFFGNLRL